MQLLLLKKEIIDDPNEITNEELTNRFNELKNIRENELKEGNEIDEEVLT